MLQFQFAAQELLAAILASVSVANEDVLPRQRLDPQTANADTGEGE